MGDAFKWFVLADLFHIVPEFRINVRHQLGELWSHPALKGQGAVGELVVDQYLNVLLLVPTGTVESTSKYCY